MRRLMIGMSFALAAGLTVPAATALAKSTSTATSSDESGGTAGMSKEDQEKLKEHNKLRAEIKKVKYPAPKATVVAHVKGIKPDDKKWFDQTLPDKTYGSADEVFSALGWETQAPEGASKTSKTK
jgi:hypothetical protein